MIKFVPLLLLMVTAGSAIPFEDCGSEYNLVEVFIDGCPRAPCGIFAAENLNVTTRFYPSYTSDRLENDAYFFVSNIEVPAVVNKHTCQLSNSSCVVVNGELKEYVAEVYVNEDLPPVNGQLVWHITNEDKRPVMCFKVSVRVNG